VSQSPTRMSEDESPSSSISEPLRKWLLRSRSNATALFRRLGQEAKTPLDAYEHLRRRLTGEEPGGTISKRVVTQLERSERAYKGWETRWSKEQNDGERTQADERPEG